MGLVAVRSISDPGVEMDAWVAWEAWTWEVEEALPRLPNMGRVNRLALWVSASLNWCGEGGRVWKRGREVEGGRVGMERDGWGEEGRWRGRGKGREMREKTGRGRWGGREISGERRRGGYRGSEE